MDIALQIFQIIVGSGLIIAILIITAKCGYKINLS